MLKKPKGSPFHAIFLCAFFALSLTGCEIRPTAVAAEAGQMAVASPKPTPLFRTVDCGDLKFRAIVTQNHLMSDKVRSMTIFLQPEAYSEENLRTMFTHYSRKYPEPESLLINVETDWERLPTADQCPTATSGSGPDATVNRSHRAKFRRVGGRATFRYNPVLNTFDWTALALNEDEF